MQIKLLPLDANPIGKTSFYSSTLQDYFWLVVVILFILLILFVFRFFTAKNEIGEKYVSFSRQETKMQTGDLVFVSYNNLLGYFMRGWTNSKWTHVGMILRDKDDVYVMETADYSSKPDLKLVKNNGILVVPIQTWRKIHKNHLIGYMSLKTPENWNRNLLASEFLKIQNLNLDSFGVGPSVWMKVLWKSKYKPIIKERQNITCFELIVKLLQGANVAQKIYTPGSYYVNDLLQHKLELTPGFSFETPVELV